eukprot:11632911-Alexandrium_andersonii.AAC.1
MCWTRALRPVGPAGTAASPIWNVGPFSTLDNVVFRSVVGPTYETRLAYRSPCSCVEAGRWTPIRELWSGPGE